MPAIKATSVRDLKLRVNVVDVVSRVATLRKAGARFKGLCPFHQEKTPSFHVDPDKGFYKCFGCGKAGDIISFVRETEQLSFTEAVEALGQRHGVVIEYEEGAGGPTREERSLRQELFDLHEFAAEHFHQAFKAPGATGEFMRRYWETQRRFTAELADEFRIGAADAGGSGIGEAILRRKYSEDAIRQSGLFFVREGAALTLGSLKPRFRGRLMIPIRDHQGRVVAFTARQTELTPGDDPAREAKYVNSPETPIFTKGNLLFNLDRSRAHAGEGRPFVLVEGQLDALRCWSVGLKTAIAPQGTSITEPQLVLLRRYHAQVECFFDSDAAGQKASLRLIPMALKAGIELRFLMPGGDGKIDPDLLLQQRGLAAYEEIRKASLGCMQFFVRCIEPEPEKASAERLQRDQEQVFELVLQAESRATQEMLLSEAGRYLRATSTGFREDFLRYCDRQNRRAPAPEAPQPAARQATSITPERHLLMLCLHYEALGKPLSAAVPPEWIDGGHPAGVLLNRMLAAFAHDAWPGRDHLDELLETAEERELIASVRFETPAIDDPSKNAVEGLRQLRARALEPRLRQLELDLATPRADSNADPISLLRELADLRRQLHQPIGLPAVV